MIVLDASVLIAWTEASDTHHPKALQLLTTQAQIGSELYVHPLTLAEFLVGPILVGREKQAEKLIADAGISTISETSLGSDWVMQLGRVRAATRLKMPDAVVLASAQVLGFALATFDDRLAKTAISRGIAILPDRPKQ